MGFIFGGDTGTSYDQLQRKRKIADAMLKQSTSSAPRNVGEGLTAIGQALAGKYLDKKISGKEEAESEAFAASLAGSGIDQTRIDLLKGLPRSQQIAYMLTHLDSKPTGGGAKATSGYDVLAALSGGQPSGGAVSPVVGQENLSFGTPVAQPDAAPTILPAPGQITQTPLYDNDPVAAQASQAINRAETAQQPPQQVSPANLSFGEPVAAEPTNQFQSLLDANSAQIQQVLSLPPSKEQQSALTILNNQRKSIEAMIPTEEKQPDDVRKWQFYANQEKAAGRTPLSYGEWSIMDEKAGNPALEAAQDSAKSTSSDVVIGAATRALGAARDRSVGGLAGNVASYNPSSNNAEVYRQVGALKSIASAESLNAMRRQSKTGGALGNVTEKELKLLSEQGGALDPASPNFERDLADYTRALMRTIHGYDAGDAIFEADLAPAFVPRDAEGWQTIDGVKIRVKQ